MAAIDVFNGDADGLCALHQIRLADPLESELVTGVKRDIELLRRVEASRGDHVTVLDISLDKNREHLLRLLEAGATVRYFDHHYAGDIPAYPGVEAHIDTDPEVCTALLVDRWLGGPYRPWAVTAAFGDNMDDSARRAAEPLQLDEDALQALRGLGIYLNYNGYGATEDDLLFAPDELYRRIRPYEDPFAFIAYDPAYGDLRDGYRDDMERAASLSPELEEDCCALYVLPDAAWARRVSGVLANRLSDAARERAHALVNPMPDGSYRISVRAPAARKRGAAEVCRQFPTGGGREAAAGINHLPAERLDEFVQRFQEAFR